jgi:hypothetical protein
MAPRLWRIALIVETGDGAEVEPLADVIGASRATSRRTRTMPVACHGS